MSLAKPSKEKWFFEVNNWCVRGCVLYTILILQEVVIYPEEDKWGREHVGESAKKVQSGRLTTLINLTCFEGGTLPYFLYVDHYKKRVIVFLLTITGPNGKGFKIAKKEVWSKWKEHICILLTVEIMLSRFLPSGGICFVGYWTNVEYKTNDNISTTWWFATFVCCENEMWSTLHRIKWYTHWEMWVNYVQGCCVHM